MECEYIRAMDVRKIESRLTTLALFIAVSANSWTTNLGERAGVGSGRSARATAGIAATPGDKYNGIVRGE